MYYPGKFLNFLLGFGIFVSKKHLKIMIICRGEFISSHLSLQQCDDARYLLNFFVSGNKDLLSGKVSEFSCGFWNFLEQKTFENYDNL